MKINKEIVNKICKFENLREKISQFERFLKVPASERDFFG